MSSPTLATRLRLIVNVVFGGNASRAASTLGMAVPAFHRLLTGSSANPRSSTLTLMARKFGVTTDYLLGRSHFSTSMSEGLNEEFWLLTRFYEANEGRLRKTLMDSAATEVRRQTQEADYRRISDFSIIPYNVASPLHQVIGPLFESTLPATEQQVRAVRQLYEAQASILEVAVTELSKTDAPRRPAPR